MLRIIAIHLHIGALITLTIMGLIILTRLKSTKREYFIIFLFFSFLYILGTLFQIMATTLDGAMIGRRVLVLGGQMVAPFFLLFVQKYCEQRLPRLLNIALFSSAFLVIALVWTYDLHGLMYTSIYMIPEGRGRGLVILGLNYGILLPLAILIPLVCIVFTLMLLIRKAIHSNLEKRKRLGILIFCAIIPGVSAVLPLFGSEVACVYVNALLITLANVAVYLGLFKHDLLENEESIRSQEITREMIGNISHDLKTPLTAMSVNIESLLHVTPDNPNYSRNIRIAYNKSLDLQRLIQNLIEITRMQTGHLEHMYHPGWISLNRLLAKVQDNYSDYLESVGLSFDVSGLSGDVMLYSDPSKIWNVFDNLIYNAVRHTDTGGITIATGLAGDNVIISVSDTGCGVSPEDLPKIFDRFYIVTEARGSRIDQGGLGLCIVKSVMEGCGGSAQMQSVIGVGTSVVLTFKKKEKSEE